MFKKSYGRNKERRVQGEWRAAPKLTEVGGRQRTHFARGKPLSSQKQLKKGRRIGVYGCAGYRATYRCRSCGVSERAIVGKRAGKVLGVMERTMKKTRERGPERKRKEKIARHREQVRGTVRGGKRKRGLPVRGQRTSTNGKTAKRLNAKRRNNY
jgi:ribosomal protein S13